jgi:site-specific DNA-methyltransferase (adenine-specific)
VSTKDYLNQVINCDCRERLRELEDKSIDLILTDSPYGIDIGSMNFVTSGPIKVGAAYRNDYSDHDCSWDTATLNAEDIKEFMRVSKNQVIFGANQFSNLLPPSRCWVVWDKKTEDKYANDYADCELIWTSFNKPSRVIRYLWSGMLQEHMNSKEKRFHPTQKPEEVMRKLILMFSKEGDIILDPFIGSGTTAIACKALKRNYIGFEINPKYCKIANQRLSQKHLWELE